MSTYTFIENLAHNLPEITPDSIISRTLHQDDDIKVLVFGFATGQELSEHTASKSAILHFISGEAKLTLGEDAQQANAGTWVHMPPHLSHSVYATTDVVMLLVLLK